MNVAISICMPAYNVEKYIGEAIESVLQQTFANWELIIVNDGSTDGTKEVVEKYISDKVTLINVENKGAAAARNTGYNLSKGGYIKFFDGDDILSPNMLQEQYLLAQSNPNCIISSKWGRFYKNDIGTFKLNVEDCWKDLPSVEWICSSWSKAQPMTQPGIFLIPRNIITHAGLWDERLSLNDDMEFYTKSILASNKVIFSELAVLYYRSGMGNTALSASKSSKALRSNFLSISQSANYLLQKKDEAETRLLVANIWQGFVYESFLIDKAISQEAELIIQNLGGSNYEIPGGKVLKILSKLLGWKMAKNIQSLIK